MAKATKKQQETKETGAPEGWEQTSPPRGSQNWVKFEEGLEVKGKLLGRFDKKDRKTGKTRYFYQIELVESTTAYRKEGKDSEAEAVECGPGELVCVDEKFATQCLKKLAGNGAQYLVLIRVGEKIDIGGGQTMWNADVFHKLVSGKPRAVEESDDIPF